MYFRNLLKRKLLLDPRTKSNTKTNEMTTKSHIRKGQRDSIHVSFHCARTLYLKSGRLILEDNLVLSAGLKLQIELATLKRFES